MAKVTIIIEDNEDGSVGVTSSPDVRELTEIIKEVATKKINVAGSYVYGMRAMTAILKKSTEIRTEKLSKKKPKLSLVKKKGPK